MERIQLASEEQLRAIVLALCKDDRTEKRVLAHLGKLNKLEDTQTRSGTKRKATEPILICLRCSEAFSEQTNHATACIFHDGYLAINYDHDETWADWDEDCHGTMDTDENREEWPEGFTWDCCDKDGTGPGCIKGQHSAIQEKRTKLLKA